MNGLKITLENLKPSKMDTKAKYEAQKRIQQRTALQIYDNPNDIQPEMARSYVNYKSNNN